ncbi:MAG: RNA polymerase sigma factor [Alphaproteobacteria bacterium]|nr:RNA polymerase sigma factor [Alphaproteobacteria bacterium]
MDRFRIDLVALLPRFRRFGYALTGSVDAAYDLVQAACERALSRAHQWTAGTRLDSWMYTIMRSIWHNNRRGERVRSTAGDALRAFGAQANEQVPQAEARLLLSQVETAVAALPDGQREALLLVCAEGYSYREAADILQLPIGTLMSRLARARRRLAEEFAPEGAGELAPASEGAPPTKRPPGDAA